MTTRLPAQLRWSHGTNSRLELETTLATPDIDMIEADVMLVDGRVIMSHPPVTTRCERRDCAHIRTLSWDPKA